MTITIHRATLDHAPAITSIKRAVWPGESPNGTRIAAAIVDAHHRTHVACRDACVVGFVDGFKTVAANGQRRWEVDLLAVHPDYHGQKIGQQLIARTTQQVQQMGATLARALVQIDNLASQHAFQRCGYLKESVIYSLMVTDTEIEVTGATPDNAHLIPVSTMNYRGLWLEGDLSHSTLAAAQIERARREYTLAGTLIPVDDHDTLDIATTLGYTAVSHFEWWIYSL